MNSIKFNAQFFLVKFPILFPFLYGVILYTFPQFETELILITILLLAETHFGATWPFLIDRVNYPFIKKNRVSLMFLPIIIVVFSTLGFFVVNKLFLLIFFAANMYHVTRQSFGIGKLYCFNDQEKKYQENLIYFINFIFFLIGYLRFYIPIINESNFVSVNVTVALLLIILSSIYIFKFGFSENFLIFFTGCLIFYPICFVQNPVHAIIMGVTMHYTQYLYFTYKVCDLRNRVDENNNEKKQMFSSKIYNYLSVIIVYSIIMTGLSFFGKYETSILKNLILIPIVGQLLHFYLDSQLWKFSDKYNRDNTLIYLSKIIRD